MQKNTVMCSAHKINPSYYKKLCTAALHGCFLFQRLRKESYNMSKPPPTPALMQNSMCYWNPLGPSKTYVEVQKKLNTLKSPWEQNPLVCKWHGQNVYQLVSQVLIHTHLLTLWCESGSNNIVFKHRLHDRPKGVLQHHWVCAERKLGVRKDCHLDLIYHHATQR